MHQFSADLYTLLHRGQPGDVQFYADVCATSSHVLELGCGDGRILCPLVHGHPHLKAIGLDLNPGMVARARTRVEHLDSSVRDRIRFEVGDMRDLQYADTFDTVIMPFTTVFCIPPTDLIQVFRGVERALKAGGKFVFDCYTTPPDDIECHEAFIPLTTVYEGDSPIYIFEKCTRDVVNSCIDVTYAHSDSPVVDETSPMYVIRHHIMPLTHIADALTTAGFVDLLHQDFFTDPTTNVEQDLLVISASKRR